MDTTKLLSLAMIVLVGTLCVGVVALATDFIWDASTTNTRWVTRNNWDQNSGHPDDVNDNATIEAARFLCTYDPGSALTINNLGLAGASPTKRKLHIKDAALTVDGVATLGDYAELDVDQNLTIDDTDMSGGIWIDVADSTTADLGTTVDVLGTAGATGISCILDVEDNNSGALTMATLTVDAAAGDVARGLKVVGSNSTLEVTTKLALKSKQAAETKRAKLWVGAGMTVDISAAGDPNSVLEVDGGDSSSRRAELDIDDTLTAEETQFKSGYAAIDVAPGKTAKGGDVIFEAGAILVKTGSGTFRSGAP